MVDEVHVYITPAVLGTGGVEWMGGGQDGLGSVARIAARAWLGDDVLVVKDMFTGIVETLGGSRRGEADAGGVPPAR